VTYYPAVGQLVTLTTDDDVSGEVVEVTNTATVIRTTDGRLIHCNANYLAPRGE
jgi:small-conductance mechanosensitive channel